MMILSFVYNNALNFLKCSRSLENLIIWQFFCKNSHLGKIQRLIYMKVEKIVFWRIL
jgi:hypothetical protein